MGRLTGVYHENGTPQALEIYMQKKEAAVHEVAGSESFLIMALRPDGSLRHLSGFASPKREVEGMLNEIEEVCRNIRKMYKQGD